MKSNKLQTISAIVLFFMIIIGCKTVDTDPSAKELAFEMLAGNWTYGTSGQILLDGQDVSLNYPDFSLSFTDGTYTTSNGGDLFRATGTWDWFNEDTGQITLDDGKELKIVSLTETRFNFTFTMSGNGGVANNENGSAGNYNVIVVK